MIHAVSDDMPAAYPCTQRLENWAVSYAPGNGSLHPGILVADDDQSNRTVLWSALRKHGFRVFLAGDGEEALEIYGLRQMAISLVLMEVHMPILDGPATLGVLRDFDPDVACCFMSANLGEYRIEHLRTLSPLPLFEKPLLIIEMVDVIWQLMHHLRPSAARKQPHQKRLSHTRPPAPAVPVS